MKSRAKLAALLSLALARPAAAEDCSKDAKHPEPCQPVEVVVTGTRTPESSQRATVRTDVVTREEAERRGATNVAEALQGEPTLQVNPENYGYLGRPSGAQMQGLDADRVLVLEDGERVIGDQDGVVDLSEIPLVDVERIEYVTGPTSSLYGTNALGGVINVIGARPRTLGPSLRYRAEGRKSGELLGSVSGAYRHDDDWLALDTSLHRRPGIERVEGQPDLLAPAWRSSTVALRAGTELRRDLELRLKARWVRDRSDGLASERKPGLDGTYFIDLPQVTDRFAVRVQETLELGRGKRLDFSLSRSWFFDDSRRDRRDSPLDEIRTRTLTNQGLEATLTIPEGSRTWVLGVRSEAERFSESLERTLTDLSTQHVSELDPILLATGALYGQLGWKVTKRWTLMPGVRGELHDRYGAVAAPRLANAFQLTEWLSARAALGRGFRAPTAKEFGFLFDHSALGYRILGNDSLRPETSWGLTGDVTARSARWRARLGGYGNEIQDLIIYERVPEMAIAGVTDYVYRNVERARTAGGDVSLRYKALESLSLEAGYAYLWTRDLTNRVRLPDRPAHTVTLSGFGELGKLNGTLRYRIVSEAYAGLNEQNVALYSPSFGLLDARVAYRLFKGLEAYAGALNLLDEKRDRQEPTDTRPALGRELYLGVRGEVPAD